MSNKVLAIRVRRESEISGYKHLRAIFVWIDLDNRSGEDTQYGSVCYADSYGDEKWANDLVVNSQANTGEPTKYYGMGIEYRTHSVDLRDCERMLKTLRSIESKLEKHVEKFGYVQNMADYLHRVAIVTKCKYILIPKEDYERTEYCKCNGYRYKCLEVNARGKSVLEDLERDS